MLFPTTLVGSFPQPDWLIDRQRLTEHIPPRVRASDLWRIPEAYLAEAQDDATLLAIRAQEDAGIDIVTAGEIRRQSYSNRFATALEGIDLEHHGIATTRSGKQQAVPRIVGKIRRKRPVELDDLRFLKSHTKRQVKITVPGPFTMSQQAQNDYYGSVEEAAMDYAAAVNEEIRFIRHALDLTKKADGQLALLVRFQWIAGKRAAGLISSGPLDRVIVLTRRIRWFDMGERTNTGQHHHAWLFFDFQRDRLLLPPSLVFAD